MCVPTEDERGIDSAGLGLDSLGRARTYRAVGGHAVEPESTVIGRRCMAEINLVLINKGRWQARYPIEVLSLKLAKIAARRCACPIELDEAPILVS